MSSYLRHGLAGTEPKVGGWTWEELQVGSATWDRNRSGRGRGGVAEGLGSYLLARHIASEAACKYQ